MKENNTIIRIDLSQLFQSTTLVAQAPEGAEPLYAGFDGMRAGAPTLWMKANLDNKPAKLAFARMETGKAAAFDLSELNHVMTTMGAGKSDSQPGKMSMRTIHIFLTVGEARETIIEQNELAAAVAEPIDDDKTPDDTGHGV